MTLKELREKNPGILAERVIVVENKRRFSSEEHYWLGKRENGDFFIGFSPDGFYCSRSIIEQEMLEMINDKKRSSEEAFDIYFTDPHLNSWLEY